MASRETELFKDKIEVSLDGRQIFYLFFGGAVIVGMVFVLGVMVGRRVEARGHVDHAQTPTSADPLAALDRLEGNGGLSFHGTLLGNEAQRPVEKAIGEIEKARVAEPAVKPKADAPKVEAPRPPEPPKASDKQIEKHDKPEKSDKAEKADRTADAKSDDKSDEGRTRSAAAGGAKSDDKPKKKKDDGASFTLQVSSFQDKGEAEALLSTVRASGFQAYLTSAEVDGKGTFYRVRIGKYGSMDAANDAKAEFEKTAKRSALVTRL